MNEFKINPIEKNGQRVLTTAQLAEAYGTTEKIISQNFNRNRERFIEGVHFYRLTGEALKKFKTVPQFEEQFKHTPAIYLWTERGALLHAKSLNTEKAWEVYEFLVDNYFHTRQMMASYNNTSIRTVENQKVMQKQINALEKKINVLEKKVDRIEKKSDDIIDSDNHIIIPFIKGIIERLK